MAPKTTSLQPSTGDKQLTAEDIQSIRKSWDYVKQDIKTVGFDLFIKFFTNYPDYQKKFKSFQNVPLAELRGNARVSAHANNVLYTLTGVIDSVEDSEVFQEMVEKLAENHIRRKIELVHFENLGFVIVDLLIEKLGDEIMNLQTIDAWKKAYLVILDIIRKVMERKATEKSDE